MSSESNPFMIDSLVTSFRQTDLRQTEFVYPNNLLYWPLSRFFAAFLLLSLNEYSHYVLRKAQSLE